MKTILLAVALVGATLAVPASASSTRAQDPQQVMGRDLHNCTRPDYPASALAQGIGGKTTVEVRIGERGRVIEARVLASSGSAALDQASLAGIRDCTFHALLAANQTPSGWLKAQYVWAASTATIGALLGSEHLASTRKLAAAGDSDAQNRLGAWYEKGYFSKPDLAQAATWYRRAAESGNAVAQNNLGVLYNRGAGVPFDKQEAVAWYAKAAEQGHGWAQANLAYAYQYGSAGEQDTDKALYWLTRSAEGGLADAQARLGVLLMRRAANDDERAAAAAWIARAAQQNSPQGMYYLGRSYELGLGKVQDDVRAAAHYRAALGRSDGRAETALAMLIDAGRAGSVDEERVTQLYQVAMQSRHRAAFYHYGLIMERRGDPMAAAVMLRGAELGDCQAVLKIVQLQAAGADLAGDSPRLDLAKRAEVCAQLADLPPQL